MSELLSLAALFVTILGLVLAAGYKYLQRRSQTPELPFMLVHAGAENETHAILLDALASTGGLYKGTAREQELLRERLLHAGYHSPMAPSIYRGVKILAGIVIGLLLALLNLTTREDVAGSLIIACAGFGFGYRLPELVIKRKIGNRRLALRRGLPNAIDLLVLSLEAGQTVDYACLELARQLRFAYPELAGEFGLIHTELRTGSSRADALRSFAARCGEPEIRKLATMLTDGDRFGTQIAATLRIHARYMRLRMRQQAQEAARKIGVKMVFPLVLLIFPSLLLVTLGPALLQMQQVLGHMFDGL